MASLKINFQTDVWKRSIFKQMFENTIHFQTHFEKIPLAPPPAAPPGRCRALGRGIFSKSVWKWTVFSNICLKMDLFSNICLKMDHIWLILFSNSPLGQFFKISPFSRGRKLPILNFYARIDEIVQGEANAGAAICRFNQTADAVLTSVSQFEQCPGNLRPLINDGYLEKMKSVI